MKILIVEDDTKMRQLITCFINEIADEIRECADGDEALAVYKDYLPDWVLMDIEMKRMGGFEAAKQIIQLFPNAKIIFVTAYNIENLRTIAHEIGAKAFVLKENLSILCEILSEL